MDLKTEFTRAFRCSTPLIAIETPDPAEVINTIIGAADKLASETPLFAATWDLVSGMRPKNKFSEPNMHKLFAAAGGHGDIDPTRGNPVAFLECAKNAPKNAILVMMGADALLSDPATVQAIWNLRDLYSAIGSCLVMLGAGFRLPASLKHDVHVLDDPLPGPEAISAIVQEIADSANIKMAKEHRADAAAALQGLSSFAASQVLSISCVGGKCDHDHLWERKRKAIEQTPGLSVWRGEESFDGIGGIPNVKEFLKKIIAGRRKPETVVFIDEIEKALAGSGGAGGDTSGVSQGLLQQLLTYMQDQNAAGCIFIGPPGTSKSMAAKATGNEAGCDTVCLDMGGMKGSLVGESEQRMRDALKVISAHSNGKSLWIATCNSIGALPPELRRRFTYGTFFFDLPDAEERAAIWEIYQAKYKVKGKRPQDEGWTGAEIKQCCDVAWAIDTSLEAAAQYVVPVSISAKDQIENLRTQASGRFLAASKPGIYIKPSQLEAPAEVGNGRRVMR